MTQVKISQGFFSRGAVRYLGGQHVALRGASDLSCAENPVFVFVSVSVEAAKLFVFVIVFE